MIVVLISAVEDRKIPVIPRKVPRREDKNRVAMKGVQRTLWSPMASRTMSVITVTAFSVRT